MYHRHKTMTAPFTMTSNATTPQTPEAYLTISILFRVFWIITCISFRILFCKYVDKILNENVFKLFDFGNVNNKYIRIMFNSMRILTPRPSDTRISAPAPHITAIKFDKSAVEIPKSDILEYVFNIENDDTSNGMLSLFLCFSSSLTACTY